MTNYMERYKFWLNDKLFDEDTKKELRAIEGDENEIKERFYCDLEFGTAGLRGIIGAGTNRMNLYTVGSATQGVCNFILGEKIENPSAVIAYDSRNMSYEFALETALVFGANGIKTYLFTSLRPTPELSYAIRELKTTTGVVITASHNPKEYNGYKVYWSDGAQISPPNDEGIIKAVKAVTDYNSIKKITLSKALESGIVEFIDSEIDDKYVKEILSRRIREVDGSNIRIAYTPFNGAGSSLVKRVLKEGGFNNVFVVEEQENPDGNFTTVGYPNPENQKAYEYALKTAKEKACDIIIATDPDSDRLGVMVKNKEGSYTFLTGNMIASLLGEYILSSKAKLNILPKNSFMVKTIVSTNLVDGIAKKYNTKLYSTLTGFKYICAVILNRGEENSNEFILGFEESHGYLVGAYARDKDAVSASLILCEMASYNKSKGLTLLDRLEKIYEEYGYCIEETISITHEGIEGLNKIKSIMTDIRKASITEIGGIKVSLIRDYLKDEFISLTSNEVVKRDTPPSDVLKYDLADGGFVCVRPSGTEPKIKIYIGAKGKSLKEANDKKEALKSAMLKIING